LFGPALNAQRTPTKSVPISFPSARPNPNVTQLPTLGPGWHLAFASKGFGGRTLDSKVWTTCYPWWDKGTGCTNSGNSEREWYMPSQIHLVRGVLNLVATRKPVWGTTAPSGGRPKRYACRSAMVTSFQGFRFMYGYVRIAARLTLNPGLWSALWLAAANFQWPPEIDIIESWGLPWIRTGVYFHPRGAKGARFHLSPAERARLTSGWHYFSLRWTPRYIAWFIDGKSVLIVRHNIPHQPMYLIANLADYSLTPPGSCHGALVVNSIKVWQR
jgi:beta-glucanase (GH16 family)